MLDFFKFCTHLLNFARNRQKCCSSTAVLPFYFSKFQKNVFNFHFPGQVFMDTCPDMHGLDVFSKFFPDKFPGHMPGQLFLVLDDSQILGENYIDSGKTRKYYFFNKNYIQKFIFLKLRISRSANFLIFFF